MEKGEKIEWSALEYEEKERNTDWFWALGVIVVAGAATSIIFGNYFFAALLVIGGALLGFFAVKKPEMISYEINDEGFQIKTRLYPYEDIRAFWVQSENPPTLFIHSKRLIMPIISVPIEAEQAEKIQKAMLAKGIKEVEMKEHMSEKIMEALGF
jgi:hypothetical protein